MATSNQVILGLSGEEIINDVLHQVRDALKRDCNLRATDSYGRGYSGSIKISLKCFALDAAEVEATVNLRPTSNLLNSIPETPKDAPGTDVEVEADIEVPVESDLTEVRKRSGQGVPMMATSPDGTPTVRTRNYAPPVVTAPAGVDGGALDETVPA